MSKASLILSVKGRGKWESSLCSTLSHFHIRYQHVNIHRCMYVHTYALHGWMEKSCCFISEVMSGHTLFFSSVHPHSCLYSLLAIQSLLLHFLLVSCSDLLRHLLIFSPVVSFFSLFSFFCHLICVFFPLLSIFCLHLFLWSLSWLLDHLSYIYFYI